MDLPTLDFSQFLYGSKKTRFALAVALVDSFKSHGFVKLTNHGIAEDTVEDYLSGVLTKPRWMAVLVSTNRVLDKTIFRPTIRGETKDREHQGPASAARLEHCWCWRNRTVEQGQFERKRSERGYDRWESESPDKKRARLIISLIFEYRSFSTRDPLMTHNIQINGLMMLSLVSKHWWRKATKGFKPCVSKSWKPWK